MAADKRTPRRGAGGGGFGGGGGGRGRQGGGQEGGRGGGRGGWQPRPPRPPGGSERSPGRGAPREASPAWAGQEPVSSRGPGRLPSPRSSGRWEAVGAESLAELAAALNTLGVQPERLVRLVGRTGDADTVGDAMPESWVALVWVD